MNNWRFLLLALVAVFQPIASFTERNLVDGRQQCCDEPSPLRDSRSSFHGSHRPEKTTTAALQRLNDRDEIHHDRRNELGQRDSVYNFPLTERRLLDIRASGPSRSSNRALEYRLERRSNEQSRDRLVVIHKRENIAKVRHFKPDHLTHREVDRTFRTAAALERRNVRGFEISRERTFRDDHRTNRYGNERQSKTSFDSQREIRGKQIRSGELRLTLNRDARHVLRQSTDEVSRIGAENLNNRPHIMRARLSEVRYESSVRADSRRNIDNNQERRQLERNTEQRRSLFENTPLVHRIRDMRIRINFREKDRENVHRIFVERFGVRYDQRDDRRESRQLNKENTEIKQLAPRITREPRIMSNINNQGKRNLYGRQEIRHQDMMHRETRDEIRAKAGPRLSRERIQMNRRNNRESKIMSTLNRRDVDNKNEREINYNNLLERINMERKKFLDLRIINNVITRNDRDIDSIRAIRYDNRLSRETRYGVRENSDRRYSRDQMQERNNPNESEVDGQRQIRYNEKRSTEIRREIKENPAQRLLAERIQLNRRQNRESRVINAFNERGLEIRSELRQERLSREIRVGTKENSDRRIVRDKRQVDRRDIRESRIIKSTTTGMTRETESKRDIRYERSSKQVRNDQFTRESRVESRAPGRVTVTEERDISVSERRTRSADNRNFRQIRTEPKLSRSTERQSDVFRSRVEHRDKIENREREIIEVRSRNVELARNREIINRVMAGKVNPENDSIVTRWQYVLYTLQAAYLCTLLMHVLTASRSEKPHKMNLRWWRVSSHYNPIKVD